VIIGARDQAKAERSGQAIAAEVPTASLATVLLDLADLESVRAAAATVASYGGLDLLVNNAGVMATPYRRTVDGFELQMGTNHLGHFALTGLLAPALLAAGEPRVVTVSSLMHRSVRGVDLSDPRRLAGYRKWDAYGQSKLANLLFAMQLDRIARRQGWPLRSMAAHPGYASTRLQTRGPQMEHSQLRETGMRALNAVVGQSATTGAWPSLYAATRADLPGGSYVGPRWLGRGVPRVERPSRTARDESRAARLWAWSESATGISYGSAPELSAM
jgi:NAD(P)-dependent dehydrogenase (short-subunit alcohol dehydrogenase family)